jgi:hypothetical protein
MSKGENMVERCARALYYAKPRNKPYDQLGQHAQQYVKQARAVIEALMEPERDVVMAGICIPEVEAVDWVGALFATGIGSYEQIMMASYQTMLRAALSQPNEGKGE